jgi:AcrR family transcriptional regulator
MPRAADEHLQERIVKAAQRLWRTRGEKGLTLRAVARAARTTTTTVYKRFRNKEALRVSIAERVYRQLTEETTSAPTLNEVFRRHLRFAETHPREYQLLFGPSWTEIFAPGRPRPLTDWLLAQLAENFGGKPDDYLPFRLLLFLTTHGGASLLAASPRNPMNRDVRAICITACDTMIDNVQLFTRRPEQKRAQAG